MELKFTYGLPEKLIGKWLSHDHGIIGRVARTGQVEVCHDHPHWSGREAIFDACNFETMVGVPLKRDGTVEGILFVAYSADQKPFIETDLEILERFAYHAVIAWHFCQLMSPEQRRLRLLPILHKISDYIQSAGDLDKIIHAVLTGVTAGYGLGFNRAALFLLDEREENLTGHLGIGHLIETNASEDWERIDGRRLEDFEGYLEQLNHGLLELTPLGEMICGLRLPLGSAAADFFARTIAEGRPAIISQEELAALPADFIRAFQPASALIVVPLKARDQVIGLLITDNRFTPSPTMPGDVDSLQTFANTAAIAIDNARLLHATEVAQQRLRSLWEASRALVSSQDPKQVLTEIVERARAVAGAKWVRWVLIDELNQPFEQIIAGTDRQFDMRDEIRPNGISAEVKSTGYVEVIENTNNHQNRLSPIVLQEGIGAALCLPLSLHGKHIGVMWLYYDKPRYFPESEINDLQLYANQAAIAYDSTRRLGELENMRHAAEALAGASGLEEVLRQILQSAREVLQGSRQRSGPTMRGEISLS